MSSGFQVSVSKINSLTKNDAMVTYFEEEDRPLHDVSVAATTTTPHSSTTDIHNVTTGSPVRFGSLNLDELSEELDRRTKETQRLQEEVEHATKLAFERAGCTYSTNSTPRQTCHAPMFNIDRSPGDSDHRPVHHCPASQPVTGGCDSLPVEVARRGISFPGKEVLENAIQDYSQQVSKLQKQLTETHKQHEEEKCHFRQTIITLQTKLQEGQMERDVQADLRMKDSRELTDQMERMRGMMQELQNTKRSGDQRLQEAQDEASSLSRKAESLERTIKEVYSTLMAHEKRCGDNSHTSQEDTAISPSQLPLELLAVEVLHGLEHENDNLQGRLALAVEQLGSEEQKRQGEAELVLKEQKDRKHAESQASFYGCQVTELESALSIHKDKVCSLEQQLAQSQSKVEEAQRGRERSLLQAEELDSQLRQLTSELRGAREELAQERAQNRQLQERIAGLDATAEELCREMEERSLQVRQLETLVGAIKEDYQAQTVARRCAEEQLMELQEQLCAPREQQEAAEARLQALLEETSQQGRKTQALLKEREEELQRRQQELQQGHARLKEALGQCQALRAEAEELRLKLGESEKLVGILTWQVESGSQNTVQHGRTIDTLHQRNNHLTNQLNHLQLEIRHLRAEMSQQESGLAAMEQERHRLQASKEGVTLENQQLTAQVELQSIQLLKLTEEHKELQELHISQSEEHEGVVLKLRSQLKSAHAALDQASSNIRTLEGADGHGLQVAMGMQKQITARRDQVDSLQGRIQQLQEKIEKLHQEKTYQSLEKWQRTQELASVREEKSHLASELDTLRSKHTQLKDRVSQLEAALHKMSESFADCQNFIQLQEQEFARLKLQHALNLKELQGQNLRMGVSATPPALASPIPPAPAAPPSARQASKSLVELRSQKVQQSSTPELRSLVREVRELRGVISENFHRPHTASNTTNSSSSSGSFLRRRSAPERVCSRTTLTISGDMAEGVTGSFKVTKEAYSSEHQSLRAAGLDENNLNSMFISESHMVSMPATATSSTSFPLMSLGRRSPVHSLLTSDPKPDLLQNRPEAAVSITNMLTLASPEAEVIELTRENLKGKLDNLQATVEDLHLKNIENSSFIRKTGKFKEVQRLYSKTSND